MPNKRLGYPYAYLLVDILVQVQLANGFSLKRDVVGRWLSWFRKLRLCSVLLRLK